jgi:hypothetical protein
MQFLKADVQQIEKHGLSLEEVNRQLQILKNGLPFAELLSPAVVNDGIVRLTQQQIDDYVNLFEREQINYQIEKFVPASGAATRMFKEWVFFYNNYQPGRDFYERFIKKHDLKTFEPELDDFFDSLSGFAFYEDLLSVIKQQDPEVFQLDENEQVWKYIHYILSKDGLGYETTPKALIKFHRYHKNDIRTSLEEHLIEAGIYAQNRIHFTISPQHNEPFDKLVNDLKNKYPVQVSYSFQKPKTDTVMLDMESEEIVRDENNKIVFRPGGHGSLLENIQDLQSDIIFVKNIDNVQKGNQQEITLRYKKALGGYLIALLIKVKKYLVLLRDEKPIGEELKEIENFAKNELNIHFIEGFDTLNNSGKRKYLAYKMNRPIRVAGMVKNTGEPGGGPFWARDKNQLKSLQIIEKAQIDVNNSEQKEKLEKSTHFNPVDLVLSIKNFEGNKFDLQEFINEQTAFITEKSYQGKPVKVYERPGLWNGSMDDWTTIFIEVPLETFTPVKTVTDLLKQGHI